jgi:hypothetical protein
MVQRSFTHSLLLSLKTTRGLGFLIRNLILALHQAARKMLSRYVTELHVAR